MKQNAERDQLLAALETLLQAPGANPWEHLRRELVRLPRHALRSLRYRVQAARSDAYDDGEARGRAVERGSHWEPDEGHGP